MMHRLTHRDKSKHQRNSSSSKNVLQQSPVTPTSGGGSIQRNVSTASSLNSPTSSKAMDLKERYDYEKSKIIESCFSKTDEKGLVESYITHVRIVEDSHYPAVRPPPNQPESSKKHRTIILSVLDAGQVRIHKARANENGNYQIGKTWNMDDLTRMDNDLGNSVGFTIYLGKAYYWTCESSREKNIFINSILKVYKKYTKGGVPKLKDLDSIVDIALRTPTEGSSPIKGSVSGGTSPSIASAQQSPQSAISKGLPQQTPNVSHPVQQLQPSHPIQATQAVQAAHPVSQPQQPQTHTASTPIPGISTKAPLMKTSSVQAVSRAANSSGAPPSLKKQPSLPSINTSAVTGGAAVAAAAIAATGASKPSSGSALTGPALRRPSQANSSKSSISSESSQPPQARKISAGSPSSTVKAMQARLQAQMNESGGSSSSPSPKSVSQTSLASRPPTIKQSSISSIPPATQRQQSTYSEVPSITMTKTSPIDIKSGSNDITRSSTNTIGSSITPTITTSTTNSLPPPEIRSQSPPKSRSKSPPKSPVRITTKTSKAAEMHNKSKVQAASIGLGAATGAASVAVGGAAVASSIASNITATGSYGVDGDTGSARGKPVAPPSGSLSPSTDDNALMITKSAPTTPNLATDESTVLASASTPDLSFKTHSKNRSSIQGIKIFARSPNLHSNDEDDFDNSDDIISLNEEQDTVTTELKRTDQNQFIKGHRPRQPSSASNLSKASKTRRLSMISNASVIEETLEDFNWDGREDVDTLEANITKELLQIQSSNVHNVVDLDERLDELDRCLDSAIEECSKIGHSLGTFSVLLGTFGDSIAHIEGQGQGLQVQTTNQKTLWNELSNLLHTVSVPNEKLQVLTQCNYDSLKDLPTIELAAIDLYKAVQAVRTTENSTESLGNLKALREKRHIYDQAALEFISRTKLYLDNRFKEIINSHDFELSSNEEGKIQRIDSYTLAQLYPFSGIILFVKEIDILSYSAMIKSYDITLRSYYNDAISNFLTKWQRQISSLVGNSEQFSHGGKDDASEPVKSIKRSGTIARFKPTTGPSDGHNGINKTTRSYVESGGTTIKVISHNDRKSIQKILKRIFDSLTSIVIGEQEAVTLLFHQSSFGDHDFPTFSKSNPIDTRIKPPQAFAQLHIREIDPDYTKAQELSSNMANIFDTWFEQLARLIDIYLSKFNLGAVSLLAIIEIYLHKLESSNQDFLIQVLGRLKDRVNLSWQTFITGQINAINNTFISSKKREGAVIFVRRFPEFASSMEEDLKDVVSDEDTINTLPIRKTLDSTYEKVSKAIFHNLQRLAKDNSGNGTTTTSNGSPSTTNTNNSSTNLPNDFEDKELLNYHVMMIENMNILIESLRPLDNYILQAISVTAQTTYRKEMDLYILQVLHRPIGKLLEFVQAIQSTVDKNPNENPSKRHGLSKSTFRKLLSTYDQKEIRKGIEALRKRVEKHFNDEGETNHNRKLVDKVWSATQAQYSVLYSDLVRIESKYYLEPGESSQILFTKAGIISDFGRV